MRFTVVTLFPGFFTGPLGTGILGRAVAEGRLRVERLDLRQFGEGRHRVTDDYPFGGGAGMVMKPGPVVRAVEAVRAADAGATVVLLTPQGRLFDQGTARRFAASSHVALVCGRYEGFDERVRDFCDEELSLGDFVLMGGETAALAVMEASARLVPGVLGAAESPEEESLADGLLEYAQYTRPRVFRGRAVPEVLLSGDHGRIARWRRRQSLRRTLAKRPELVAAADLTAADRAYLEQLRRGEAVDDA